MLQTAAAMRARLGPVYDNAWQDFHKEGCACYTEADISIMLWNHAIWTHWKSGTAWRSQALRLPAAGRERDVCGQN